MSHNSSYIYYYVCSILNISGRENTPPCDGVFDVNFLPLPTSLARPKAPPSLSRIQILLHRRRIQRILPYRLSLSSPTLPQPFRRCNYSAHLPSNSGRGTFRQGSEQTLWCTISNYSPSLSEAEPSSIDSSASAVTSESSPVDESFSTNDESGISTSPVVSSFSSSRVKVIFPSRSTTPF